MAVTLTAAPSVASARHDVTRSEIVLQAEETVTAETLRREVEYLSDSLCAGRSSIQRGGTEAAFHLIREFRRLGLLPMSYMIPAHAAKSAPASDTASVVPQGGFATAVEGRIDRRAYPQIEPAVELNPSFRSIYHGSLWAKTVRLLGLGRPRAGSIPADSSGVVSPVGPVTVSVPPAITADYRSYICCGLVDGHPVHNIIGMIPAENPRFSDKYIIICAHYDGLGILNGKMYPGADSNASGVAALLALAEYFRYITSHGAGLDTNIIFAALDGKQFSLAGSQHFATKILRGEVSDVWGASPVRMEDIRLVVNLDILGGTESTLRSGRSDYLLMLGGNGTLRWHLDGLNRWSGTQLDLAHDYYGSEGFTDLFYRRVSDQRPFIENGVEGVMFTSGITMYTNKTEDDLSKVDFAILKRRIRLIYHWLDRVTYIDF